MESVHLLPYGIVKDEDENGLKNKNTYIVRNSEKLDRRSKRL